jgi:hypothetical protein
MDGGRETYLAENHFLAIAALPGASPNRGTLARS